jgi:hypothetical protein
VLVVATDGLFKYATPGAIAGALRGRIAARATEAVAAVARLPSGRHHDDLAIVIVHPAESEGAAGGDRPSRP